MSFKEKLDETEKRVSEARKMLEEISRTVPTKLEGTERRLETSVQQAEQQVENLRRFAINLPVNAPEVFKKAATEGKDIFETAMEDLRGAHTDELAVEFAKTRILLREGQTLFKEGQRLEREGKIEEAKRKYEQAAEIFEKANAIAFALKTYSDLKRTGAPQEFLDTVRNAAKAHIENLGKENVEARRSALMLISANSYIDLHASGMFEQAELAKDFTISIKDRPTKEFEIVRDQIAILQAMTGTSVSNEFRQEFLNKLGIAFSLYNIIDTRKPKEEIQKQLDKAAFFTAAVLQLATYSKMSPAMQAKLREHASALLQAFENGEISEELVIEVAFHFSQEILDDLLATTNFDGIELPNGVRERIDKIIKNIKGLIESGETELAFQAIAYLNVYKDGARIEAPFRNEQVIKYIEFLSGQMDEEREILERCMPEFEKLNRYVQTYREIENTQVLFIERKVAFVDLEKRNRTVIFNYNSLEQQLNVALDLAKAGNFEQAMQAVAAAHAAFVDIDHSATQQARQITIDMDIEGLEHFRDQIARYRKELLDKDKEFAPKIAGPNLYSTLSNIASNDQKLVWLEARISVRIDELRRIKANSNEIYNRDGIIATKSQVQEKFDEIVRYTTTCLDQLALINSLAENPGTSKKDRQQLIVLAGLIQNALEKIGTEPPNYERTRELLEQTTKGLFDIARARTRNDQFVDEAEAIRISVLRNTLSGAYSSEEADVKGINYGLYIIDASVNELLTSALTTEDSNHTIQWARHNADLAFRMIETALANEINTRLSYHAFEQCMESFQLQFQARTEKNNPAFVNAWQSMQGFAKIPSLPANEHEGMLRAGLESQTNAMRAFVAKKMGEHNANHRLFLPTESGTALLTDQKFEYILDEIAGRYRVDGEFIPYVSAPSTFLSMTFKDVTKAVLGLRARWTVAGEREMQYNLFDLFADSMKGQRSLIEYAITENKNGRTITQEQYSRKSGEIMKGYIEARYNILVREGDSENAERFAGYLRDIEQAKGDRFANLRLQHEIGDALLASELAELSGEMRQFTVDVFGGLLPGYASITEYARTGRVGGWTLVLDAAAFIPFAGQATRAASGARAGIRAAKTTTNVSRMGRAAAYAEAYAGRTRLALSEVTGATGRLGTALDISENISDIGGIILGGYYTGSEIYDDISRRRQLGLRGNLELQQYMNAIQAGLPVFLWSGMHIADSAGWSSALNRELNPVVYIDRFSSRVAPYIRRVRGGEWTQIDAGLRFVKDEFVETIKMHGLRGDNPNRAIRKLASEATDEFYQTIRERIDSGLEKIFGENVPQEFRRLADERIEIEIELREAAKRANTATQKEGAVTETKALADRLDENLEKWKQGIENLRNRNVAPAIVQEVSLENVPTGFPTAATERFGTDMRIIVRAAISENIGDAINSAHARGELTAEEWAAFFNLPEDVRTQRVADVVNRQYNDRTGFQPKIEADPTLAKHGERSASARRQAVGELKKLEQEMGVRLVDESRVNLHKTQTMHYDIGGAEHARALEHIRERSPQLYERMDTRLKRLIQDPRAINADAKYVDYKLLALLSDEQTFLLAASDFAKTHYGQGINTIDNVSYLGAGCFNAAVRVDVTLANGQKRSMVIRGPGDASPDIAVNKLLNEAGVDTFNSSTHNYEGVDENGRMVYISAQDLIEGRRLSDVLDDIRAGRLSNQEIENFVRGYFDNLAVAHFFGLTDNHEGNFMIMSDGSFMRLDYGMHMGYGDGNRGINKLAEGFIEDLLSVMDKTKLDDNLKRAAKESFTKRWERLQANRGRINDLMSDMISRGELYTGNGDSSGSHNYDRNGNVAGRNGLRLITETDFQRYTDVTSRPAYQLIEGLDSFIGQGELRAGSHVDPGAVTEYEPRPDQTTEYARPPDQATETSPATTQPEVTVTGSPLVRSTSETAERNVRIGHNVDKLLSKEFLNVALTESIGGNADTGAYAVNVYLDDNGRIVAIGNPQTLDPKLIQDKFVVAVRKQIYTDIIVDISYGQGLSPHARNIAELSPDARMVFEDAVFEYNQKAVEGAPAKIKEAKKLGMNIVPAEPYSDRIPNNRNFIRANKINAEMLAEIKDAINAGREIESVSYRKIAGYDHVFRVRIGEREFIYKNVDFAEQEIGIKMYKMLGLDTPAYYMFEDGTVMQPSIGSTQLLDALKQPMSASQRQELLRQFGKLGAIDSILGIPGSQLPDYMAVGGRLIKIDFENTGLGWGYRKSGTSNAEHEIFWQQLGPFLKPGDLRAFYDGIVEGFAAFDNIDAQVFAEQLGRYDGIKLRDDGKFDMEKIADIADRMIAVQDNPAAILQMQESAYRIMKDAVRYGKAEKIDISIANEALDILKDMIRKTPNKELKAWKERIEAEQRGMKILEISDIIKRLLDGIDGEIRRRA